MHCEYCGKDLPETLDYCPNCKINEMKVQNNKLASSITTDKIPDNVDVEESKITNEESPVSNKKRNISSVASFILALIPYLLIIYCIIVSGGSFDESGSGAVWWLMIIYYWSLGFPILLVSLFLGGRGWKSDKKIFSYISLVLNLLPFILLLFTLLAPLFIYKI